MMNVTNEVDDQIRQILANWQVLTDYEDRYVYSFEKIYSNAAYPLPDIVVKINQPEDSIKFSEWAKDKDFNLITRSTRSSIEDNKKMTILLDDTLMSDISRISDDQKGQRYSLKQKLMKNTHSSYKNISMAIQLKISEESLTTCLKRNICGGYCTITPFYKGIETWSAKGRFLLIRGLMRGDMDLSQKLIDIIYTCSKCGNCFSECFSHLDFHKAITRVRQLIVEKDLTPSVFQTTSYNIETYGDPAANPVEKRFSWIPNISNATFPETADILYWVGCMVSSRTPKTALAFYNILKTSKADFKILIKNEGCCGYVLLSSGLWEKAKTIAYETIEKIENSSVETLVTPCAGCYYTFKKLYPEILNIDLPCDIQHSTQFIERELKSSNLRLKPTNVKITYHDPCSLGRHSGIYKTPRYVLKAIPGLELIEMTFNEFQSRCCGGGGGLWNYNYQISMDAALKRLYDDFTPLNIGMLTTACPLCQMNFRITAKRNSIPIKVNDITEMIDSVLVKNPE